MDQPQGSDQVSALRTAFAADLFVAMPRLNEDIEARPGDPQQSTLAFVESLVESETPEEALVVCAYGLLPRHAVWWGHECLMRVRDRLSDRDGEFLQMAADWVGDPSEERRAALIEVAAHRDENPPPSPGQWIAMGAGWSGGSMNPSDLPEVPAAPHLLPTAI